MIFNIIPIGKIEILYIKNIIIGLETLLKTIDNLCHKKLGIFKILGLAKDIKSKDMLIKIKI